MDSIAGSTLEEVTAALARVERALANDRTLDDYPDYQAVRLVTRALDELLARTAHHDQQVAALRLTLVDALGWVHAFDTGDAEAGEASMYLDSMPNDLLPDEHFDPKRLEAVRALSLEPLLALGVQQSEALDRAWDALMNQEPRVTGGVLLRLEPVAVSILFRLALEANDWRSQLELVVVRDPVRLDELLATGTVDAFLGHRDEEGNFELVLLAIDGEDRYRLVGLVDRVVLDHYRDSRWAPTGEPIEQVLAAEAERVDP